MKRLDKCIEFNWLWDNSLFIIPTIEITRVKCVSILWLRWSLDFNY